MMFTVFSSKIKDIQVILGIIDYRGLIQFRSISGYEIILFSCSSRQILQGFAIFPLLIEFI